MQSSVINAPGAISEANPHRPLTPRLPFLFIRCDLAFCFVLLGFLTFQVGESSFLLLIALASKQLVLSRGWWKWEWLCAFTTQIIQHCAAFSAQKGPIVLNSQSLLCWRLSLTVQGQAQELDGIMSCGRWKTWRDPSLEKDKPPNNLDIFISRIFQLSLLLDTPTCPWS